MLEPFVTNQTPLFTTTYPGNAMATKIIYITVNPRYTKRLNTCEPSWFTNNKSPPALPRAHLGLVFCFGVKQFFPDRFQCAVYKLTFFHRNFFFASHPLLS